LKSRRIDLLGHATHVSQDDALQEPSVSTNGGARSSITHTSPGSYLGRAEYISGIVPIDEEDAKKYGTGRESDVPELDMRFLRELRAFDLPARSLRESLISHFMERCHPWMPIVSKSDLAQTSNFTPSILLLQAVFAAGSRVSMAPHAQSTGHAFYRRAKALYYSGAEKNPLDVIRAICIVQWWNPSGPEHVSMDASSFWLHMGVALAVQVGLHREPNPKQPDASLRRRLWWTLYARDCMISMSHGRPRAINSSDSDVRPLSLSDFPSDSQNHAHLFIVYVEICSILGDLSQSFVRGNLSRSLRLQIETRLSAWITNMPPSLQIHSPSGGLAPYNFLSRQLHIPYFTALTILFRPTSPSTPPSAVPLLASSFASGIFEDFLARGEIPMLASVHILHIMCVAMTQLACYRYPTLWSRASTELNVLNQALAEMSKRYPSAFGAQRVVRDVERAVKKLDRYTGALHLGLPPDQTQYFSTLGPELCSKWDFVYHNHDNHHNDETATSEILAERSRRDAPVIPANTSENTTNAEGLASSMTFQDPDQTATSLSMAPPAWDGPGSADFTGMMAGVFEAAGGGGEGAEFPFGTSTIGNWMLSDWMTDLGW
jgi:hypothetical protein